MEPLRATTTPSAPPPGAAAGVVTYSRHDTAMHAQRCAIQLGSLGGRGAARRWCVEQGFGHTHTETVIRLASALLVAENRETVEQTRARLLVMLESELDDAQRGVHYDAKGNAYVSKDRSAIAQFTKLIVTLTGLDVSTVRHVAGKDRPLREMSTQDLLAEEERLAQEIADRAKPVEATLVPPLTDDEAPIPSDEKTQFAVDPNTPIGEVGNLVAEVAPAWVQAARDSGLALRVRAGEYGA